MYLELKLLISMEKLLDSLKDKMLTKFKELENGKFVSFLEKNERSLFLTVSESGLNWQKKKIENLFESSAIYKDSISFDNLMIAIEKDYVSECMKPSKKGFYFINLNGLYFIESKNYSNLGLSLISILQSNFYKEIKWVLTDEEKLIVSLLILFNAFNEDKAFRFTISNEVKVWDFMMSDLANGLSEIGICKSFNGKIALKNTKYTSGKNFISGYPSILSRTGLFVPKNGNYYLKLTKDTDYIFLIGLLFDKVGFNEKVEYIKLMESYGKYLFENSIIDDIFVFNEKFRKVLLD